MSTYNGSLYLPEQLASIIGQTHNAWRLFIRDDGSSDSTISIVEDFARRDPRISLVSSEGGNLGPWASFGQLLALAKATKEPHIFFSDQDDVWLPDKIESQLQVLRSGESALGQNTPLLVHSDLEVVDDALRTVHPSFVEYQNTSYDHGDPISTLLIHNAIVGCTIGFNRPLLDFAVPLPAGSPHDWWLALCASAIGRVVCTKNQTVRYRQHAGNAIGARARHAFLPVLLRHPAKFIRSTMGDFGVGVAQAGELYRRLRANDAPLAVTGRVERYVFAFERGPSLRARLRALKTSRAKPRRRLSRLAMIGIVSVFPRLQTT
jgi:rhamnosyltransferase